MTEIPHLKYFQDRVTKLQDYLSRTLAGEKLVLDPAHPFDREYIGLLNCIYENYDLDSPAALYYVTAEQEKNGEATLIREVNTETHPLTDTLGDEAKIIMDQAHAAGVNNIAVFGADLALRNTFTHDLQDGRHISLFARTDNFVLSSRSDLVAMMQCVSLITRQMEGVGKEMTLADKAIVLDATSKRHHKLLNLMGIESRDSRRSVNRQLEAVGANITVTLKDNTLATVAELKKRGINSGRQPAPWKPIFEGKPEFFFATGSEEKIWDSSQTIIAGKFDACLRSSDDLGGPSRAADEFTGSHGGNALDKLKQTLREKNNLPAEMREKYKGSFIVVSDSGEVIADKTIIMQPEFDDVRDLIPPGGEFFGPESKPVAERLGGSNASFQLAHKILERFGSDGDRTIRNNCVFMIAPLEQKDPDHPVYYAVKSTSIMQLAEKPSSSFQKTRKDYLTIPGTGKTLQELEDAHDPRTISYPAFGRALTTLLTAAGAPQTGPDLSKSFNKASGFTILTNHNYDAPTRGKFKPVYRELFKSAGLDLYDRRFTPKTLDDVREFLESGQGYMFTPPHGQENILLDLVIKCGIFVGKQLGDHMVNGNPWINYNPKGMPKDPFIKIAQDMGKTGMMSNIMQYLNMHIDEEKIEAVIQTFNDYAARHRPARRMVPEYPLQMLPDSGRDNMSVIMSASTGLPEHINNGGLLAHNLGRNNLGGISGMGRKSTMGMFVYRMLELKAKGYDIYTAGVQDPYAVIREEWPKDHVDRLMGPGHAIIANDRYERIKLILEFEKLRRNPGMKKVLFGLPGGIGTVEEFAVPLWMRSEGEIAFENLRTILLNTRIECPDGVVRGIYDEVLSYAGKVMEDQGLVVVESVKEGLKVAGEHYGRKLEFHNVSLNMPHPQYPFESLKNPDHVARLFGNTGHNPALQVA